MEIIFVFIALAALIEGTVEYIFGTWLHSEYLRYVALVAGVAVALAYQLDVFQIALGITALHPLVGQALTGLLMGRGSSFVHDFYKSYLVPKAPPAGG